MRGGLWRIAILPAAVAAALACAHSASAQVTERLPDLVADAPANPQLQTYTQPDGNHLLLRFDGFVHNQGVGALEVRGSNRVDTEMTNVVQRVYRSDGSFFDDSTRDPRIIWEPEDGHDHWHLKNAARYSLWNSDKTAEVAPAMKVGFCLIDSERRETHGPSSRVYDTGDNNFCGQDEPTRSSLFEGVSAGWRDNYDRTLAFQWVDVTDVQPGTYWLRAEIDPDDVVREANEVNAATFRSSSSTIPGYRANPVNAGVVGTDAPTTVNLSTTSFGSGLGTRAFRVIVPPKHGTLIRPAGEVFSTASVTYTPHPGWVGPDSFTYEAHDSASSFPRFPATAGVTLNVGGVSPNVAISGAPATMQAGTSARLFATVIADNPYVRWTVDGIDSGTPATGTVDAWGLYEAPASAPPAGQVTIRATSPTGAFDEVTIGITNPAAPQPAPTTALALAADTRVAAEADPAGALVSYRPRRAGVARVRVRYHDRLVGRCKARTPRGRALACRVRLPQGAAAHHARVIMTLRVKGRLVEVRRTWLRHSKHSHH